MTIYTPYAHMEDTAADLTRNDLKLQVQEIVRILLQKKACPSEWSNHLATLAYVGTLYVELLKQKYSDNDLASCRDVLAIGMIGTHDMPDWVQRDDVQQSHQGFLKFLGLCRVYVWKYKKQPPLHMLKDVDELTKALEGVKLPKNVRPDYSQYDVPLCNTVLRCVV